MPPSGGARFRQRGLPRARQTPHFSMPMADQARKRVFEPAGLPCGDPAGSKTRLRAWYLWLPLRVARLQRLARAGARLERTSRPLASRTADPG